MNELRKKESITTLKAIHVCILKSVQKYWNIDFFPTYISKNLWITISGIDCFFKIILLNAHFVQILKDIEDTTMCLDGTFGASAAYSLKHDMEIQHKTVYCKWNKSYGENADGAMRLNR